HPATLCALPSFPTRRSSDLSTPGGNTTSRSHAPQLLQFTTPLTIHDGRLDHVAGQAALLQKLPVGRAPRGSLEVAERLGCGQVRDRKSTRLNSSHVSISYAV